MMSFVPFAARKKTLPKLRVGNCMTEEEMTKTIADFIYMVEDSNKLQDEYVWRSHYHMCTFDLLNNKNPKKACKAYRHAHPLEFPEDYTKEDRKAARCDFCPMFNYVAVDDQGRIMYVTRNFPEQVLERLRKWKNG